MSYPELWAPQHRAVNDPDTDMWHAVALGPGKLRERVAGPFLTRDEAWEWIEARESEMCATKEDES